MKVSAESFRRFVSSHDPLVSVIVPTYNKGAYLRETLASALAQDWGKIEVVVVDDGSTDDSAAIAAEVARSDPRVRVLTKPNGGISDARNFAIERAAGRVIAVLDGDDLMEPSFVRRAVGLMREEGVNLVCCDVQLFGGEEREWVPQEYDAFAIRYDNSIPTMVAYDRALWQAVGGYSRAYAFNEDWDFFIRCSDRGMKVGRIREKLFRYRVTDGGLAKQFINDTWRYSVSLMATSVDHLYPVSLVLQGHSTLHSMPERWIVRMRAQEDLHPNEWLLPFWAGLFLEGRGETEHAKAAYARAKELSGGTQWQPLFRLALAFGEKDREIRRALCHIVRTLRPDMAQIVGPELEGPRG